MKKVLIKISTFFIHKICFNNTEPRLFQRVIIQVNTHICYEIVYIFKRSYMHTVHNKCRNYQDTGIQSQKYSDHTN